MKFCLMLHRDLFRPDICMSWGVLVASRLSPDHELQRPCFETSWGHVLHLSLSPLLPVISLQSVAKAEK